MACLFTFELTKGWPVCVDLHVLAYMPRWFACQKVVTHASTNRANIE